MTFRKSIHARLAAASVLFSAAVGAHADIAVSHTRVAAIDESTVTYALAIDNLGSADLSAVAIHVAPVDSNLLSGDTGIVIDVLPAGGHATVQWNAHYSLSATPQDDQAPKTLVFIGTTAGGEESISVATSYEGGAQ